MSSSAKNLFSIFLFALFSAATVLAEFGLIRALQLGSVLYIALHCGFIILFQSGVLAVAVMRWKVSVGKKIAAFGIGFLLLTLLWLLLIGYREYVAGIVCTSVVCCLIALFSAGGKIKRSGIICAGLSLVLTVTAGLACYLPKKVQFDKRIREVPLADHSGGFAYGNAPKTVYHYLYRQYSTTDGIMLKSLQGCLGLTSDTQILLECPDKTLSDESYYIPVYLQTISTYYPDVAVEDVTDYNELIEKVAPLIENYIYCDEDDQESTMVAFNLCHHFRSVVVGKTSLPYAEKFGWKRVFNTTGKDQKWLMESEYFGKLSKSLVFMSLPFAFYGSYADYAVVSGSWLLSRPESIPELEKTLARLDRNFIVVGGLNGMDERAVVSAASRYGGTFIFSGGMNNVSVLSAFRPENAVINQINTLSGIKKQTAPAEEGVQKGKHTVCIMLSDGDNMRFMAGQGLANPRFLGSATRTENSRLTYGMSGMAALLMPIVLLAHYDRMGTMEDYVMQLGSVGYVFPSYWQDEEAFGKVTDLLAQSMEISDVRVVEIMDDISFLDATDRICNYDSLRPYFDKYTRYDTIDGCLFINFMDLYAGFEGKICWSNDKPVVSARYSVWNDDDNVLASEKNSIEYIADAINRASRDETSEDGYSFVIMHAWSGLDERGNFVPRGDTVAAMNKLVSLLNDDVDVVTAEEFIDRIQTNVKR